MTLNPARSLTGSDQRFGLLLIAGSLVAAVAIAVLAYSFGQQQEREELRLRGMSASSMLAQMPLADLVSSDRGSALQMAAFGLGSRLAYAAITDPDGRVLGQISTGRTAPPPAPVSSEPASWYGERAVSSLGRAIMEFHAPVLEDGDLRGLVRIGYFAPDRQMTGQTISTLATFAFPVFLLVPFAYLLVRRALAPIQAVQETLQEWSAKPGIGEALTAPDGNFTPVVERLGEFCRLMDQRMSEVERRRDDLRISASLLTYRQRKMDAVLDALPCAVAVLDEGGVVTYASARLKPLLGLEPGALLDQRFVEHCRIAEVQTLLTRQRGRRGRAAVVCASPLNPEHQIEIAVTPLRSAEGEPQTSSVLIVSDVTEAERARQSRTEFVGHVSHELKTPLNVLSMYSEMLLGEEGESREFQIEAGNVIHDEVERLAALIGNLLSMTKIEMGSLGISPARVRLPDLLQDVSATMARSAEENGITCREELPREMTPAEIDKDLFRVAMNNLVSNAIKYNRPGGAVTVAAEETESEFLITVKDTGVGISDEDRQKIFDRFYRADNGAEHGATGHGLGLALARDIIELHHGTIEVQSELGAGSTFIVRLKKSNTTSLVNR